MRKRQYKKFSEKNRCRFCRSKSEIDYKDVATLQKLCTPQGKLFSRKRSGNCAKHQRKLKNAIKLARAVALMPYVG
jgi:small subunit ribosomal protein S18